MKGTLAVHLTLNAAKGLSAKSFWHDEMKGSPFVVGESPGQHLQDLQKAIKALLHLLCRIFWYCRRLRKLVKIGVLDRQTPLLDLLCAHPSMLFLSPCYLTHMKGGRTPLR